MVKAALVLAAAGVASAKSLKAVLQVGSEEEGVFYVPKGGMQCKKFVTQIFNNVLSINIDKDGKFGDKGIPAKDLDRAHFSQGLTANKKDWCQPVMNDGFPLLEVNEKAEEKDYACKPDDEAKIEKVKVWASKINSGKADDDWKQLELSFTFQKEVSDDEKEKNKANAYDHFFGKNSYSQWWQNQPEVFDTKGDQYKLIIGGYALHTDAPGICKGIKGEDSDGSSGCVSGDSEVLRADGSFARVEELSTGDLVQTRSGFEPVLGMIHQNAAPSQFTELTTAAGALKLTSTHMVFLRDGSSVEAREVAVGTELATAGGFAAVTKVAQVAADGFYAPLTASGTLVVDGLATSCYSAPAAVPLSHSVAHLAMTPFRAVGIVGASASAAVAPLPVMTSA